MEFPRSRASSAFGEGCPTTWKNRWRHLQCRLLMAKHGFLNNVKHTGNTIQQLKLWGGQEYTNEAGYEEKQAVSDQNIVTANGTGQLEFCRELLLLLKADTPENIHASYDFYKNGFVR